jgi:hypothetical protein
MAYLWHGYQERGLQKQREREKETDIFLHEKKRPLAVVANTEWLCISAVRADLEKYMSDFNSRLHGETELTCDMYAHAISVRQ